mmetsp:Transcript_47563/g.113225  ORF Transcript_47563/g.113225 Transcript_47563/m.113225 type:complete len:340 (-) Transcript_47563:269-1288(-)
MRAWVVVPRGGQDQLPHQQHDGGWRKHAHRLHVRPGLQGSGWGRLHCVRHRHMVLGGGREHVPCQLQLACSEQRCDGVHLRRGVHWQRRQLLQRVPWRHLQDRGRRPGLHSVRWRHLLHGAGCHLGDYLLPLPCQHLLAARQRREHRLHVPRRLHRRRRHRVHGVRGRHLQDQHRDWRVRILRRGQVLDHHRCDGGQHVPELPRTHALRDWQQRADRLHVPRRVHGHRRRRVHVVRRGHLQDRHRLCALHVVRRRPLLDHRDGRFRGHVPELPRQHARRHGEQEARRLHVPRRLHRRRRHRVHGVRGRHVQDQHRDRRVRSLRRGQVLDDRCGDCCGDV